MHGPNYRESLECDVCARREKSWTLWPLSKSRLNERQEDVRIIHDRAWVSELRLPILKARYLASLLRVGLLGIVFCNAFIFICWAIKSFILRSGSISAAIAGLLSCSVHAASIFCSIVNGAEVTPQRARAYRTVVIQSSNTALGRIFGTGLPRSSGVSHFHCILLQARTRLRI